MARTRKLKARLPRPEMRLELVSPGGRYGLGNALTNRSGKWLVEFYRVKPDLFIARYYTNTLLYHWLTGKPETTGLMLQGGSPNFNVSAADMASVRAWLRRETSPSSTNGKTQKAKPRKAKAKTKANKTSGAIRPNKLRKVAASRRRYYRQSNRENIPRSHFLQPDERDYPYRDESGRIDCNLVSAALKRARLNTGRERGAATVLKKAQTIWNRVCRQYTDNASQ